MAARTPPPTRRPSARAFDADWYRSRYSSALESGADPLTHYLTVGWRDGMNPNALFDGEWYLTRYPDVRAAAIEPLSHFVAFGWREGRNPCIAFDTRWYRSHHLPRRRAGLDPLTHYRLWGWSEGAAPHPLFDSAWYLRSYGDLIPPDTCPLAHYLEVGAHSGLEPNAEFDSRAYRRSVPCGELGVLTPLEHAIAHAAASPTYPTEQPNRAGIVIKGDLAHAPQSRLAVIAAHDGRGCLGAATQHLARAMRTAGFAVVIAYDDKIEDCAGLDDACDAVVMARHDGYDFHSWRLALEYVASYSRRFDEIILLNDSVIGPLWDLSAFLGQWRALPFDVTGIVESASPTPHLQSWGVRFSGDAADVDELLSFYGAAPTSLSKREAIRRFEVPLAHHFRRRGFRVGTLLSPVATDAYADNPSIYGWKQVLEADVPFIKRNAFTIESPQQQPPRVILAFLEQRYGASSATSPTALVRDSLAQIGVT